MTNEKFKKFVELIYHEASCDMAWGGEYAKRLGTALHRFASINSKSGYIETMEWIKQHDPTKFMEDLLFVGKIDLPKIVKSEIFGMPNEGLFQVFDYDLFQVRNSTYSSLVQSKAMQLHFQEYSVTDFADAVRKAKKYTRCFSDSFVNVGTYEEVLGQDKYDAQPMNFCADEDAYYCRVTVGRNLFYYDKQKNKLFLGSFIDRKTPPSYMTKPVTKTFKSVTGDVYYFHKELHKLLI